MLNHNSFSFIRLFSPLLPFPLSSAEQLPLNALKSYFATKFPALKDEEIFVRKFSNGQSNPTYFIRIGDGKAEFVLRKKPVNR
jgi:aminoglycoside phosphotransferase (APT) family kinase protein